jgi:hypothetical protein
MRFSPPSRKVINDSDKQNNRKSVAVQLQEVKEEENCNEGTASGAESLNENICKENGGSFVDDRHGESWIQCCNRRCKKRYHQRCQNIPNSARPKKIVCLNCKTTERRLDRYIIRNTFNYIYICPFSGMPYLILI